MIRLTDEQWRHASAYGRKVTGHLYFDSCAESGCVDCLAAYRFALGSSQADKTDLRSPLADVARDAR